MVDFSKPPELPDPPLPRTFICKQTHEVKVKARNSEEAAWYAELLLVPNRRHGGPIEMYLVGPVKTHDVVVEEETLNGE